MLFIGLTSTPGALIDLCTLPCKGNFPSETLTMDLGGNTQTPSIGAVIRQSDFQIAGTPLDEEFLSGGLISGNYGNCAHLSLNTSLMEVVCDVRTNITNQANQTVVFPEKYAGSMLFPSSLTLGRVKINGRAKLQ